MHTPHFIKTLTDIAASGYNPCRWPTAGHCAGRSVCLGDHGRLFNSRHLL